MIPPQQALAVFIQEQLQQGFSVQDIKQYLLQQGYNQQQIAVALQICAQQTRQQQNIPQKGQPTTQKRISFSPKAMLIILIITIIIAATAAGIFYFIELQQPSQETALKFSIFVDKEVVAPGETLYFSQNFINLPEKRKEDFKIEYTIIDALLNKEVDKWQETITKESIPKKNMKRTISLSIAPGKYRIKATAFYNKAAFGAVEEFNVAVSTVEATCIDGKQNQREEDIDCGGPCNPCPVKLLEEQATVREEIEDIEEVEVSTFTSPLPLPTGTDKELRNKANNALTPDVGISFCKQISSNYEKNQCINEVAQKFEQSKICSEIQSESADGKQKRDECYFNFIYTKSEFTLCEQLFNPYLVRSCNDLKQIEQLKKLQDSGDINAIGQIVGFRIE